MYKPEANTLQKCSFLGFSQEFFQAWDPPCRWNSLFPIHSLSKHVTEASEKPDVHPEVLHTAAP